MLMIPALQKALDFFRKHPLLAGILTPGLYILALLLIWPTSYETNDDFYMNIIASGFYSGSPDEHLIYSHFLPGLVLKFLFNLYAGINWYFFYLLFFHWFGWALIASSWFRAASNRMSIAALLILFLLFETYFYLNLQFTTSAAILACGGMSLILAAWNFEKALNRNNIAGVMMITLASMIRYEPALLVSLLSAPIILFGKKDKVWISRWALVISLPVCIYASEWVNRLYYASQPGWQTYITELKNGNRFNDNPAFYQTVINDRKDLEKINGWSENDMLLFALFFRNYAPVYNVEAYDKLYKAYARFQAKPFRDYFYLLRRDFGQIPVLILAFLAFFSGSSRVKWSLLAQASLLVLASYYIYSELIMKERVIYTVLLCLSLSYLFFLSGRPSGQSNSLLRSRSMRIGSMVFLLIGSVWMIVPLSAKAVDRQVSLRKKLKQDLQLLNDPASCYIVYGACMRFEGIAPVENRFTYQNREFYMLSLSAFNKSPLNMPNLQKFGASSLENALANSRFKVVTFQDSAMIPLTPERLDRFTRDHLDCSLKVAGDTFVTNSDKRIFWFNQCVPLRDTLNTATDARPEE